MPRKPNSQLATAFYDAEHNVHHQAHFALHELLSEPTGDPPTMAAIQPTCYLPLAPS
jgi:hypothetical protein